MATKDPLRVFFSWQSELPREIATRPIERALQQAKSVLLSEDDVVVEVRSGPERAGAVSIADSIAEQILACDLYVADVSLVDRGGNRSSPNANVLFELGLAVGSQGWNRVVLLLNKQTGLPEALPFDLRGRVVTQFDYRPAQDKGDIGQLSILLVNEFRRVLRSAPARPSSHDEASIRRSRDIVQIDRFFRTINRAMMDRHLREGPDHRHANMAYVYDFANEVLESSAFRLSDLVMEKRIRGVLTAFDKTLEYEEYYRDTSTKGVEAFGRNQTNPVERLVTLGAELKAQEVLQKAYQSLAGRWSKLLDEIHDDYVEIDLEATDRAALQLLKALA